MLPQLQPRTSPPQPSRIFQGWKSASIVGPCFHLYINLHQFYIALNVQGAGVRFKRSQFYCSVCVKNVDSAFANVREQISMKRQFSRRGARAGLQNSRSRVFLVFLVRRRIRKHASKDRLLYGLALSETHCARKKTTFCLQQLSCLACCENIVCSLHSTRFFFLQRYFGPSG